MFSREPDTETAFTVHSCVNHAQRVHAREHTHTQHCACHCELRHRRTTKCLMIITCRKKTRKKEDESKAHHFIGDPRCHKLRSDRVVSDAAEDQQKQWPHCQLLATKHFLNTLVDLFYCDHRAAIPSSLSHFFQIFLVTNGGMSSRPG